MSATSADVARLAGVSRSTVSYILNGHADRFSAETREQVESAAARLNYRPQSAGRTLARGHSDIVILVTPLAPNADFATVVDVLTARLYEKGLSLLMRSATSALESFTAVVTAVRPAAVIAMAALSKAEEAMLRQAGVPTVDWARITSRPGGMNSAIGALQVDHLIQRGYSEIRFVRLQVSGDNVLESARERGVRERCRQLGIPVGDVLIVDERGDLDPSALSPVVRGTGLACYNDDTAAAVLAAAQRIGRGVPVELGIVGADDSAVARHATPRLTTIGFDHEAFYAFNVDVAMARKRPRAASFSPEVFVVEGGTT